MSNHHLRKKLLLSVVLLPLVKQSTKVQTIRCTCNFLTSTGYRHVGIILYKKILSRFFEFTKFTQDMVHIIWTISYGSYYMDHSKFKKTKTYIGVEYHQLKNYFSWVLQKSVLHLLQNSDVWFSLDIVSQLNINYSRGTYSHGRPVLQVK